MLPGAGATTSVWARQVRAFRRDFNVALVQLPGHGRKEPQGSAHALLPPYDFATLTKQLAQAVELAGISQCHVVALSLGTILARDWARRHPNQLRSAVLAGTIAELTAVARALLTCGDYLRTTIPYMLLYRMYAWIIMPGRAHRRTRAIFYRDARALGHAEFNRWFQLSGDAVPLLRDLREHGTRLPTLHVMGGSDHMFLESARELSASEGSSIMVLPGIGHVTTVEAPDVFNEAAVAFIKTHLNVSTVRNDFAGLTSRSL
jgi:pimeloyl-ACP methyl ester carboxylesterase